MSTEQRVRAAIVDLVDSYDVQPGAGVPTRPAAATSRRRGRRSVWVGIAAAAALVVVMVAAGSVFRSSDPVPSKGAVGQVLPSELPEYRTWSRPSQSSDPLRRVAMTWFFNSDEDFFWERSHTALWGADLVSVRYYDVEGAGFPVVSPNGLFLARTSPGGLLLDDLAAGTSRTIPYPPGVDDMTLPQTAWSADSRRFYLITAESDDPGVSTLWEITTAGGVTRLAGPSHTYSEPVPAPDARRLALDDNKGRIDILDTRRRKVVDTVTYDPGPRTAESMPIFLVWSPDGRRLLLVGDEPSRDGTRVTDIDLASGRRRTVTSDDFSCRPLTMLTAQTILCESALPRDSLSGLRGTHGLVTFDLTSGARTLVAEEPGGGPGRVMTTVAADLARQWRFSMSKPWTPAR